MHKTTLHAVSYNPPDQLGDEREMVLVPRVRLRRAGIEEEITREELEEEARERPHVRARIVVGSKDDLCVITSNGRGVVVSSPRPLCPDSGTHTSGARYCLV